jgi:YHS domain-containing protein
MYHGRQLYYYYHKISIKIGVKWGVFMNGAVFTLSAEAGLVCRMEVEKRKAKFTGEYEGTMHDFSSLPKRESGEKPEK